MPFRANLYCGRSDKVWEMRSGIFSITVQDSLIFRCVTRKSSLSMPAKDASPKARKIQDVVAGFVEMPLVMLLTLRSALGHSPRSHVLNQKIFATFQDDELKGTGEA
jgi:hypothetical protein